MGGLFQFLSFIQNSTCGSPLIVYNLYMSKARKLKIAVDWKPHKKEMTLKELDRRRIIYAYEIAMHEFDKKLEDKTRRLSYSIDSIVMYPFELPKKREARILFIWHLQREGFSVSRLKSGINDMWYLDIDYSKVDTGWWGALGRWWRGR